MEVKDINTFLSYFERLHERTLKVIECIPEDKLEWRYRQGVFSMGDLVRHIAAIERYLYVETILGNPSKYQGCSAELADGLENVIEYFNKLHAETVSLLSSVTAEQLQEKCTPLNGQTLTKWKWLRAMTEHHIHHRGQLYTLLSLHNVKTPPIFGLSAEEVRAQSEKSSL